MEMYSKNYHYNIITKCYTSNENNVFLYLILTNLETHFVNIYGLKGLREKHFVIIFNIRTIYKVS